MAKDNFEQNGPRKRTEKVTVSRIKLKWFEKNIVLGRWVDGYMGVKAVLRIACSNQKYSRKRFKLKYEKNSWRPWWVNIFDALKSPK